MGVPRFAADFRTAHAVGKILFFLNQFFLDGPGEAGPAAAGIKLVRGKKQGFPRRNVHINAGLVVIEIFVAEGRFRRIVPRNCKLLGRQAAAQLVIRFFPVDGSGFPGLGRLLELAGRNMAVAAGIWAGK